MFSLRGPPRLRFLPRLGPRPRSTDSAGLFYGLQAVTELNDFYVYALLRADGQTPFYIGKGRANRWLIHEKEAPRKTSHKDRIINRMLAAGLEEIPKLKLVEGLTDDDAKRIEIDLIALIGRYPKGSLANLTNGGDGVAKLAPESRAIQIAKNRASWKDPVVRKRRIDSIKATWTVKAKAEFAAQMMTPEMRARISAGLQAYWKKNRKPKPPRTPQPYKPRDLTNQRIAIKAWWDNPQNREARSQKAAIYWASNPLSEDAKYKAAERLCSPEAMAKRQKTNADPAVRANRIAAQRAAFATPEAKAKRSAASKAMWAQKKSQYAVPSENAQESYP